MQKIFLVDDSAPIRERLAAMLSSMPGTSVVGEATDVQEAISGILFTKPDVVLLDLCLGHHSGFEVLNAVHNREPGIDVYVLSNFSSEPYRRHAERLGAKDFFDKSTEFERVRETIAARGGEATTGEATCKPSSH